MERALDKIDLQILQMVQADAGRSLAQLSRVVKRSQATCFKRLQRMRELGVIRRTVTLLDPGALNVTATAMITVKLGSGEGRVPAEIAEELGRLPEVMDVFQVRDGKDLLLRAVMPRAATWTHLRDRVLAVVPGGTISIAAIDCLHSKSSLPLSFVSASAPGA